MQIEGYIREIRKVDSRKRDFESECNFVENILKEENCGPKILDVGCGIGRHACILSKCGYEVTGVDTSRSYLADFRNGAKRRNVNVNIIRGDMRKLPFRGEFDAAICMYSSFLSLTSDKHMIATLEGIRHALKDDGIFILDIWNGWNILRSYYGRQFNVSHEGFRTKHANILKLSKANIDDERFLLKRVNTYLLIDPKRDFIDLFEERIALRIIVLPELLWILRLAKFKVLDVFDGLSCDPATGRSSRLISISKTLKIQSTASKDG